MTWENIYRENGNLWGEQPSELALFAVDFLKAGGALPDGLSIADLGCGYGRDAIYLSRCLGCNITGIDSSPRAIELAYESCPADLADRIQYRCADFGELDALFPVIFISNLYQVLSRSERARLADTVKQHLSPGGLLFLSTLSTADPEESGCGTPVEGDSGSFQSTRFTHFSTGDELEQAFEPLKTVRLFEHEYMEPHPGGKTHHHIAWLMAAAQP